MMDIFTTRAPLKLDTGAFINLEPHLFALMPGSRANEARVIAETTAAVETFAADEGGELKWGALSTLLKLRFDGKILWPLAGLFNVKPLGYVHGHALYKRLKECGVNPHEINDQIENSSFFQHK